MSEHNAAADSARQLARQFKSLTALADHLDKIGNLDTVTSEAEARRLVALADEQAAVSALASARTQVAALAAEIADWTRRADESREAAASQQMALQDLTAAQESAMAAVCEALSEKSALDADLGNLIAQRDTLRDEVAQLALARDSTEAQLTSAREQMRRMLGA